MAETRQELNQNRYKSYEKIRNEKNLTDAQVAEKAGIRQSIISDWKAGRATPAFGNIVKIADAMGVAANDFEV